MMITNQKRMAAQIFSKREGRGGGIHRSWVDPDYLDEVVDDFVDDLLSTIRLRRFGIVDDVHGPIDDSSRL